jgi:hypothetical protein
MVNSATASINVEKIDQTLQSIRTQLPTLDENITSIWSNAYSPVDDELIVYAAVKGNDFVLLQKKRYRKLITNL